MADRYPSKQWPKPPARSTQADTSGADPGPGPDGDFADASVFDTLYAVCDRKYDVIAMTWPDGNLAERTDYSPYGVARQRPRADISGDGVNQ